MLPSYLASGDQASTPRALSCSRACCFASSEVEGLVNVLYLISSGITHAGRLGGSIGRNDCAFRLLTGWVQHGRVGWGGGNLRLETTKHMSMILVIICTVSGVLYRGRVEMMAGLCLFVVVVGLVMRRDVRWVVGIYGDPVFL